MDSGTTARRTEKRNGRCSRPEGYSISAGPGHSKHGVEGFRQGQFVEDAAGYSWPHGSYAGRGCEGMARPSDIKSTLRAAACSAADKTQRPGAKSAGGSLHASPARPSLPDASWMRRVEPPCLKLGRTQALRTTHPCGGARVAQGEADRAAQGRKGRRPE